MRRHTGREIFLKAEMKSSLYTKAGPISQFEGLQRLSDKPGSPNTPPFEHPVGDEVSKRSAPHTSPSLRHHDPEEDHSSHKKSVFTKVKEKAKKLKHSLSGKKKHSEEGHSTPAWGVTLEDDEDEDLNDDYLGAPVYESEVAPGGYKVHVGQQPRGTPAVSEKNVVPSSINFGKGQENVKHPTSSLIINETVAPKNTLTETRTSDKSPTDMAIKNETLTEPATLNKTPSEPATLKKTPSETVTLHKAQTERNALNNAPTETATLNKAPTETETATLNKTPTETETATPDKTPTETETASPNKTLTETVTEKLAPAYATVSDATHAIASKIQNLAVSALATPEPWKHSTMETTKQTNLATVKEAAPETEMQTTQETEKQGSPTGQMWDKGVSVKEYIMNKLEPGQDEKALSKAITEAMSPQKGPREVGVVEKVKGAVSSLLWNEEISESSMSNSAKCSSPSIPVSRNAHEIVEEETQGRVLQAN